MAVMATGMPHRPRRRGRRGAGEQCWGCGRRGRMHRSERWEKRSARWIQGRCDRPLLERHQGETQGSLHFQGMAGDYISTCDHVIPRSQVVTHTLFLGPVAVLTRLRLLMTSVLRLIGRGRPCNLRNRPQALHRTEPISSRRHSGVVLVPQFWQTLYKGRMYQRMMFTIVIDCACIDKDMR